MHATDIRNVFASKKDLIRTSDLLKAGVYYHDIQDLIRQGFVEKIRYGYYQWITDSQYSSEIHLIRLLVSDGIFCMNTALYYYNYIDRVPGEWHIAVDKNSTKSRFKVEYPLFKPYYIDPDYLRIGVVQCKMDGENMPIYNKERLMCDVLKRISRMDRELFNKSIQAYIKDSEKSIPRLMKYAKIFRIEKKVKDIIGVWL